MSDIAAVANIGLQTPGIWFEASELVEIHNVEILNGITRTYFTLESAAFASSSWFLTVLVHVGLGGIMDKQMRHIKTGPTR